MNTLAKTQERAGDGVRIRLREDLNVWLQENGGEPYYLVEDPIGGRYFRVGVREWRFASALNGKACLSTVLDTLREQIGDKCLAERDAIKFGRWLVTSQLATVEASGRDRGTWSSPPKAGSSAAEALKNPFFIRIPLLNPDQFLTAILPWAKWMLSPAAFVGWLVLCVAGGYHVFSQWDRFASATSGIFAPENWAFFLGAWVLLKIVHETFHGLVCKKYGGTVPQAGVVLILLSPVAFVEVTSSWRFGSKWQRIFTAAAGMYIEFALAATAAMIWSRTPAGVLNYICYSTVLMASLSTLVFNANPLMRFDGYYILTDLLEIQNLYTSGRQYLRYFFHRYFFGTDASLPTWPPTKRAIIIIYGWASCFWRLTVCVSLGLVATTLFHGAGLALTGMAAVMWFGVPTLSFVKYLVVGDATGRPVLWRFLLASGCCLGVLAVVVCLPWPGGVTAPGIVEYAPLDVIRTSSAGFVREIRVKPGQEVNQGQVLAVLVNEEVERDLEDLKLEIEQSLIKSRILHRSGEMAQYQAERESRQALIKRRDQLDKQVRDMTLRAPRAGMVLGRDLDSLIGQYIEPGTSLMAIGVAEAKEIRLSISEERVETFTKSVGTFPHLRVRGRPDPIRSAPLAKIEPRASVKVHHPALGAPSGGPIAVRSVSEKESSGDDVEVTLEFVAPRFSGIVELPTGIALSLRAGELVQARLTDSDDTIGRRVYQSVQHWLRKKLAGKRRAA